MISMFRRLGPYRVSIVFTLILVFIQSMTELYLPTLMADIVDIGIMREDTGYILQTGGIMLLVALAGTIAAVISSLLSSRVAVGFARDLRKNVFTTVENFSLHEFDRIGASSLITRTTNDITQIQQVLFMILRMMVSAPMMAIGGIVMAVSRDPVLSLVIVVVVPVIVTIIVIIASKGIPLFKMMQKKLDTLNRVTRENLLGIRVIRAFDRVGFEKRRFAAANEDLTDTAVKVNKLVAILMPTMMLLLNLTTIAIVWFGGIRIESGALQIGDLMAFIQYVMRIMFSLIMVSMMFIMIPRASVSAERINEVLSVKPEIIDPKNPVTIPEDKRQGGVEFRDVTFRYAGAEEPALCSISFTANPGRVTAIIGGTGSGKSTLVNLIPRFYDIEDDGGVILVDGVDIRSLTQKDLRSRIGYVPQKSTIFSGSIADSIRFGTPDATDDEVRQAASIAQAEEFITVMPDGYATEVSQGGTTLSGGQKQRLSIARAIVRHPEICIFDDSFSALDFKTDARLRQALRKNLSTTTILLVAQRVSTVMQADQIIVLQDGMIAGKGTHDRLMKECEVYQEIVSSQLSEEELA